MGTVLEVVGNAKIRQLEEFYDIFNMDDISLDDVESQDQHCRILFRTNLNLHYMTKLKQFFTEIDWRWDYYFGFLLFNGNKAHRYHRYMKRKWGDRYTG